MFRYAWLAILALVTVAAGPTTFAADSPSADAQAIGKIEREWAEAVKTKNKAFYEKHLSDDFSYISENAEFFSGRAAYIDVIMKLPKIVEAANSDERVTIHGTTGVATGRFTMKDGAGVSTSTLYTDVYAKGPDGWKAVASHETTTK